MKRRLRPILLYLLLGVALNVAVAWGIVIAHRTVWLKYTPVLVMHGERNVFCSRTRLFGHVVVMASGGPFLYPRSDVSKWFPVEARPVWLPRHVLDGLADDEHLTVIAAGWPCMTFRTWSFMGNGHYEWGVQIEPRDSFAWLERTDGKAIPITVPLQPVLVGFTLNTGFYATAVWCLVTTAAAVRRFLRQRRGLCPRCAYPRENHTVCPECGTAHKRGMSEPIAHALPPA